MNAQKLSQSLKPHNLTSLFVVCFALVVLAFGLRAGAAQPQQGGAEASNPDEREFKNTIPAHVPVKVKIKNEQSFKNLKNKNWARELEIEIKNTGAKPIYYIYAVIDVPEFIVNDYPLAFRVKYGRPELAFLETPLQPEDVPIMPGESVTLKLTDGQARGYEAFRDKEKREDPKKVKFGMRIINFGDGTGLRWPHGAPDKAE